LVPICSRCNVSMGNQYTIDEWNKMGPAHIPARSRWWQCLQIKRR
jgi:hypothetical protein